VAGSHSSRATNLCHSWRCSCASVAPANIKQTASKAILLRYSWFLHRVVQHCARRHCWLYDQNLHELLVLSAINSGNLAEMEGVNPCFPNLSQVPSLAKLLKKKGVRGHAETAPRPNCDTLCQVCGTRYVCLRPAAHVLRFEIFELDLRAVSCKNNAKAALKANLWKCFKCWQRPGDSLFEELQRLACKAQLYAVFMQLTRAKIQFKNFEAQNVRGWGGDRHIDSADLAKRITVWPLETFLHGRERLSFSVV